MIATNNGHLLAFDNLSGLPAWLSDALCRIASGGSFAVRQLYTDDAEVLFKAARPILLNGIEDVIARPDLADRAILLTLGPIGEEKRRSEAGCESSNGRGPRSWGPCWMRRHTLRSRGFHSSGSAPADGRLRALGRRLRNSALAHRHLRSRLHSQP
jgi:hypothetical protein